MITFFSLAVIYFSIVGFVQGFEYTWNLFKEDAGWLYRILPSISNGIIFMLVYLSLPIFSFILFDKIKMVV